MELEDALRALSALSQGTRLATFRLLVQAGPDGLPAGTIAEKLKTPAATMSFHLAQLTRARLITARRESRSIIYYVRYESMRALLDYLTQDCCQGHPEICAPFGSDQLVAYDRPDLESAAARKRRSGGRT